MGCCTYCISDFMCLFLQLFKLFVSPNAVIEAAFLDVQERKLCHHGTIINCLILQIISYAELED